MEERRHHSRSRVDWRVKLAAQGEDLCNGYLSDVSPAGATVLCGTEYPIGSQVVVHFGAFADDTNHGFSLVAIVRHCNRGQLGVEFMDGPVRDQDRLHYLLRGVFRSA